MSKRNSFVIFLITYFLFSCFPYSKAQKIELSPFFGYVTASQLSRDAAYMYIGDGIGYGASLNYSVSQTWRLEISYNRMKSYLGVGLPYSRYRWCDLASNYLSFGGSKEIYLGKKVNPFVSLALGWVNYNPISGDYSSENSLYFNFSGGIKVRASDGIGFRFQVDLLMPVWPEGEYFSSKYGQTGVRKTTIFVQGDILAGIIFVLDYKHKLENPVNQSTSYRITRTNDSRND